MVIGVLALQGAVGPHLEKLRSLGAETLEVRTPGELARVDGIVLPGGESTTMLHLLHLNRLWEPLKEFVRKRPAFGVCAGAILLANEVHGPEQESLGRMGICIERNAYGRQLSSFITPLEADLDGPFSIEGVFIRAPRITAVRGDTRVLSRHHGEPVMVESGDCLAATFHPELTASAKIHDYFLQKCDKSVRHG